MIATATLRSGKPALAFAVHDDWQYLLQKYKLTCKKGLLNRKNTPKNMKKQKKFGKMRDIFWNLSYNK